MLLRGAHDHHSAQQTCQRAAEQHGTEEVLVRVAAAHPGEQLVLPHDAQFVAHFALAHQEHCRDVHCDHDEYCRIDLSKGRQNAVLRNHTAGRPLGGRVFQRRGDQVPDEVVRHKVQHQGDDEFIHAEQLFAQCGNTGPQRACQHTGQNHQRNQDDGRRGYVQTDQGSRHGAHQQLTELAQVGCTGTQGHGRRSARQHQEYKSVNGVGAAHICGQTVLENAGVACGRRIPLGRQHDHADDNGGHNTQHHGQIFLIFHLRHLPRPAYTRPPLLWWYLRCSFPLRFFRCT